MTEASLKDYLKLHFIVFIWGFSAILGKLMSIPSGEVVFYRTLVSAVVLYFLLTYRKRDFALGRKGVMKTMATGFLMAAHWVLFFESARVANISVCLAGIATTTFWTSLIEPLFTSRRVRLFEVFIGLVVIAGLYVVFQFEFDNALGLTLAVISALLAAMFSVLNSQFTKVYPPFMITFYEMVGACVGVGLFLLVFQPSFMGQDFGLALPTAKDWLWLLLLALVCTVYAVSESIELMKRISAFAVNLTINLEPVYGIVMALLVFGESEEMSSGFYLGTLIILMAVLSYPIINKRIKRKAMKTGVLR